MPSNYNGRGPKRNDVKITEKVRTARMAFFLMHSPPLVVKTT